MGLTELVKKFCLRLAAKSRGLLKIEAQRNQETFPKPVALVSENDNGTVMKGKLTQSIETLASTKITEDFKYQSAALFPFPRFKAYCG